MLKTLLSLSAISTVVCGLASAGTLALSVSGQFSNSDTAGQFVAPKGNFSIGFVVDTNPVPLGGTVTSLGVDVPVYGFSYKLNGSTVSNYPTEVRFNTLGNGGDFDVTFGLGLSAEEFDFQGLQLFSGTTAAPVFSAGTSAVSSWTYSDPANYDSQTPTTGTVTVSLSPTPEPASVVLLSGGLLALIAVNFRKSRWHR